MKAKKRLRTQFNKYQRFGMVIQGTIGNHTYDIDVPGRPNYIYVRTSDGDVPEVFNNRVTSVLDLPVFIGYDPREPQLLQVLSVRSGHARYGDQGAVQPGTPEHHESHEWFANPGGNDVVFVQLRQFMPLRPTPVSSSMLINIGRGIGYINDQWTYFSGISIDLTNLMPGTGAAFALVYEDTDGLPAATVGITRLDSAALTIADIPQPIPGTLPLAAVRLYSTGTQIQINETRLETDLIDLRFPMWHDHPQYITGGSVAPTDAQYVTLANDAALSQERVLRAGARISLNDTGANGSVFVAAQEALPIFDDSVFQVSGSAISFDDQLDVSVTGSIAYVDVIDTIPWTSYQATSTIIGWDTRSVNLLYYKRVGGIVYVEYNFFGVSDATTISFTLPYTHNGIADMYELVSWVHDNSVTQTSPGLAVMPNGSATATVYKTMASGGWTNINNKGIYGNFWYITTQAA